MNNCEHPASKLQLLSASHETLEMHEEGSYVRYYNMTFECLQCGQHTQALVGLQDSLWEE